MQHTVCLKGRFPLVATLPTTLRGFKIVQKPCFLRHFSASMTKAKACKLIMLLTPVCVLHVALR